MVMRYHPGLAIGHTYNNFKSAPTTKVYGRNEDNNQIIEDQSGQPEGADVLGSLLSNVDSRGSPDSDMDSTDGRWDEVDSENGQEDSEDEGDANDDEFLTLHEMYEQY